LGLGSGPVFDTTSATGHDDLWHRLLPTKASGYCQFRWLCLPLSLPVCLFVRLPVGLFAFIGV